MPVQTVNIGILAHVDAGKTSLTERLLYDSGVIDRLGSVDAGTTQTDTGAIERRRGITIRSAVTAFAVGDRLVNVIDTPGHSDFVAEVERALGVLDGAVLVVSAVEGVQPHTRLLLRLLRTLRLPTVLFVNKIDRVGARDDELVADLGAAAVPRVVPLGRVRGLGTPAAEFVRCRDRDRSVNARLATALADHDDALLADLVADVTPPPARLRAALRAQTAAAQVYPLVFGCALSGAGVAALRDAIGRLLPAAPAGENGLRARVFAIERGAGGEKVAYLRSYGGRLQARQRITVHRREADGRVVAFGGQVAGLRVVGGSGAAAEVLTAGHIGRLRGVPEIRIGDQVGSPAGLAGQAYVARPSLETVVRPARPGDASALHAALLSLADEDPLISARGGRDGASSLLLYGEVQKEVIAATLAEVYGLVADFLPSQVVYLERLTGVGAAAEPIGRMFAAGVGLRIAPVPAGSGLCYRLEVELGALPLAFHRAIEETVRSTLEQGRYGWPVPDAEVTLTDCAFWSPISTAGDFRDLTPLVLARALAAAGTRVHEPCADFELEIPPDRLAAVSPALAQLGGRIADVTAAAAGWRVTGEIPARTVHSFQRQLAGLTSGYGVWSTRPGGDRPVTGPPPIRPRTDGNPFHRDEYLRHLAQRPS